MIKIVLSSEHDANQGFKYFLYHIPHLGYWMSNGNR